MRSLLLTSVLVLFVSGCTTSHVMLGQKRPPTDPKLVKIYSTPPKHYEAIATVSANSRHGLLSGGHGKAGVALERAKHEVAKLGANGLLLQTEGESGSFGRIKTVSGTAIYVTEE